MTYNIPATIWNLLVWSFFAVIIAGVALSAYAAIKLREAHEAAGGGKAPAAGPDPEEYHVVEEDASASVDTGTETESAMSETVADSPDE